MGKIIILESIRTLAFDKDIENLVLFGEEDYIDDTKNIYDLIFHSKQTTPYHFKKPCSLVIPVIRANNKERAIEKIYNLNKEFPDFTKFVVPREFLDFYEVIQKEEGTVLNSLGKYNFVDEGQFTGHAEEPGFEQKLEKKIREINNYYEIHN